MKRCQLKEDSHKTHTVKIPVIWSIPNRQIHRNGKLAVAKGWIMRVINNGYRLSFYDNENVLKFDICDGFAILWISIWITLNYTLKMVNFMLCEYILKQKLLKHEIIDGK